MAKQVIDEVVKIVAKELRSTRFNAPYVYITYNDGQSNGAAYCFYPELLRDVNINDIVRLRMCLRKEKYYEITCISTSLD